MCLFTMTGTMIFFRRIAPLALFLSAVAAPAAPAPEVLNGEEETAALYAATETRVSFASYCLDQLIGPDRMGLAIELARRHARDGRIEEALSLAEKEELIGESKIRVLTAVAEFLDGAGETGWAGKTRARIFRIYFGLHPAAQGLVRRELADQLVADGRFRDLVPIAYGAEGWERPYYLGRASAVFPEWSAADLLERAVELAEEHESGERTIALVRLAAEFFSRDQPERGAALLESARAEAADAQGRGKIMAYAELAEFSARQKNAEEAGAYVRSALHVLLNDLSGWEQTDALNDWARASAGRALSAYAWPGIEKAGALLSRTAGEIEMRNKYRVYEFTGIAAAASPDREYSKSERRALFEELLRLRALPGEEERTTE